MSNIIKLWERSTLDRTPEDILKAASEQTFEDVIVIGRTKEGVEYFASSQSDGGLALWRLERAKLQLLRQGD